jgi:peptidoglycan/xylan/chitin deacetylase (PgdA/CDA1 family)
VNALTILTYHSLDESGSVVSTRPSHFAAQMKALADAGYRLISLGEALDERRRSGQWPGDAVVVTFDDGFMSVHEHALSMLANWDGRATVFVITGHVGGLNDWAPPPPGLGERPLLTWSHLKGLASAGWEISSHTHRHADLRRLAGSDLEAEVARPIGEIEGRLGRRPQTFAYPYGWYTAEACRLVRDHYAAACTTRLARAGGEALDLLSRVDSYYVRSPEMLVDIVAGRRDAYLAVRRWGRSVRAMVAG